MVWNLIVLVTGRSQLAVLWLTLVLAAAVVNLAVMLTMGAAKSLGFTVAHIVGLGFGPQRSRLFGATPVSLPPLPLLLMVRFGSTGVGDDPPVASYVALQCVGPLVVLLCWFSGPLGLPLSEWLTWVAPVSSWVVVVTLVSTFAGVLQLRFRGSTLRLTLADKLRTNHVGAIANSDPEGALRALGERAWPLHILTRADAHLVLGDRGAALAELRRMPDGVTPTVERRSADLSAMARADQDLEAAHQVLRSYGRLIIRFDPVWLVGAVEAAVATGDGGLARRAALDFHRLSERNSPPFHPALDRRVALALQRLAVRPDALSPGRAA